MTLSVRGLEKRFGELVAVDHVSFDLQEGQFLTLLGPSGCGKTTTLRMIAGFERPDSGEIAISGRDITYVPARRRNIGMVFQHYALFPHLSAAQNVAFGLKMRGVGAAAARKKVISALGMVRMEEFADSKPATLSGGQQQRVALARALVIEPDLLLLDEPLSALDAKLRAEMREEISRIVEELRITTVFVTHDQNEALVLSDVVAVMNRGRIEQIDTPEMLYRQPRTAFVADFLGGANLLKGTVVFRPRSGAVFRWDGGPDFDLDMRPASEGPAVISIRPEEVQIASEDAEAIGSARVTRRRYFGDVVEFTVEFDEGATLAVRSPPTTEADEGDRIGVCFPPDRLVFVAPDDEL